jgi:hypothetical protein
VHPRRGVHGAGHVGDIGEMDGALKVLRKRMFDQAK